ncbi:bifunctional diguanylate cyclase/phosphodiesterase [Roseibium sp. M-1]
MLISVRSWFFRLYKRVFIRATLYGVCGLFVFSLVLVGIDYYTQLDKIGDRLARTAYDRAMFVTNIAAREIEHKNYGEVERLLNAIAGDKYIIAAKAYSRFGQEFASDFTSKEPSSAEKFNENALVAAQQRQPQYRETAATIEYILPVFHGGDAVGSVLVRISKHEMAGVLRASIYQVALVLGLLLLAFVPVLAFLMYRATAGVSRVTQAANEAAAGFLDCNLETDAPGEVGELQSAFRDMMVKLRENIVRIEELAYTDAITGLPNRAKLDNLALTHIDLKPNGKGSVIYIGLDRFKLINDLHGHAVGDKLLRLISHRLARIIEEMAGPMTSRPPCVARFSGDEFVVLLPGLSDPQALDSLVKIVVARLGGSHRIGRLSLSITISAGVARYPEHGRTSEEVLRNANMAMYEAKAAGRGRSVIYNDRIRERMTEREQIRNRLQTALKERSLSVHYQPKVDISSGKIVGSEALLRWNDAELGIVPPCKFIPVAEECGLIVPIGEFVLASALKDMKQLNDRNADVSIAVNVAPAQLQSPGFSERVLGIIAESGFSTDKLELEVTESSLVDYSQTLLDRIMPIKKEGVRFAIDDFGTGYSSLHSLASMPFDTLKIDRSFIMDIDDSEDRRTIVELILSLARQLHLSTVSEGVETQLQMDYINLWGGTLGQGYLWSPAVPFSDFSRMVLEETSGHIGQAAVAEFSRKAAS